MQTRLFAAVCLVAAVANAHAQVAPNSPVGERERDQVRRAVLDYVEGFYEGDTVKLTRACDRTGRSTDSGAIPPGGTMTTAGG